MQTTINVNKKLLAALAKHARLSGISRRDAGGLVIGEALHVAFRPKAAKKKATKKTTRV